VDGSSKILKITPSGTVQFANGTVTPFNLGRLKTRFPYILLVPQARFLEFITREAARYSNFRLLISANANRIVEEDGAVKGVRYQASDGTHEVRALLTVGADGRFSQMRRLAGFEPAKTSAPMDVLWFRLPKLSGESEISGGAFGGIGQGRILTLLERTNYWQAGLVFPKGKYQELHAKGVGAVRQTIGEIDRRFAKHAESLTDWQQLSLLSVESSSCLLAQAGTPADRRCGACDVTGRRVGINYAIQDAVVAANVLSVRLKAGKVSDADLAEVQRQREWPTRTIQTLQSFLQNRIIASVLQRQGAGNVPQQLRLLTKIPVLRDPPPRMIAFGPRRVRLENSLSDAARM
jgi:2-polyprenyl-6-methoxyphenol hydroxylase-like FAD-dependent oxidoreductase